MHPHHPSSERHRHNLESRRTHNERSRYYIYSTSSGRGSYLGKRNLWFVGSLLALYILGISALSAFLLQRSDMHLDQIALLRERSHYLQRTIDHQQATESSLRHQLDIAALELQQNQRDLQRYRRELQQYIALNERFILRGTSGIEPIENGEDQTRQLERELTFARSQLQRIGQRLYEIEEKLEIPHSLETRQSTEVSLQDIYSAIGTLEQETAIRAAISGGIPLDWPAEGRITSRYGYRTHPVTGQRSYHTAYDIANRTGTPIHTTADGIVRETGSNRIAGKFLVIDHGFGFSTKYDHLHSLSVNEGQQVMRGQVVALMGNTGRSTGPHLHYEVRYQNRHTNPKPFLAGRLLNLHQFFRYSEVQWHYSQLKKQPALTAPQPSSATRTESKD